MLLLPYDTQSKAVKHTIRKKWFSLDILVTKLKLKCVTVRSASDLSRSQPCCSIHLRLQHLHYQPPRVHNQPW